MEPDVYLPERGHCVRTKPSRQTIHKKGHLTAQTSLRNSRRCRRSNARCLKLHNAVGAHAALRLADRYNRLARVKGLSEKEKHSANDLDRGDTILPGMSLDSGWRSYETKRL